MGGAGSARHRHVASIALVALPAIVLAGCVGGATEEVSTAATSAVPAALGPLVELLVDAAGDAYESADLGRDSARLAGVLACDVAGFADEAVGRSLRSECLNVTSPYETGEGMPRVGPAADPALDALAVYAAVSGERVVIELETARIADTLDWVKPDSTTIHQVCWDSVAPWTFNRTLCDHAVILWLQSRESGATDVLWSAYVDRREDCTSDWYSFNGCLIPVPYALDAGTPGRIRWEVPRAWFGNVTEIAEPFGLTQQGTARAFEVWPFCPCPPDPADEFISTVDVTPVGATVPLPAATGADPASPSGTPGIDPEGDWLGRSGSAEMDILSTRLLEDEANLTLSVELATVAEPATPGAIFAHFGLPRRSFWATLRTYDESIETRAIACSGRNEFGWCAKYGEIPVRVTRTPGSPGRVDFNFERADLEFPVAGDLVHSVTSSAYVIDRQAETPTQVAQRGWGFRAHDAPAVDYGMLAPATRLRMGVPPRTVEGAPDSITVDDDQREAYGNACMVENCRRFDITYVEVSAIDPTAADVTIGIADLSIVRVPPGYHAVVYAVGVRTEEAQTMVGYSRDEDNQDKFFCGPDNLVLVGTPLDPASVASTPITGVVTLGQRAQGVSQGAGAAAGSITLHVPHECFGKRAPGPLRVDALGAGTFAVSNPSKRAGDGSVEPIDSAAREEPFTIASVAPPLPPPEPWYARDLFWNVFGAFLAVVTVLATIYVFYRRRRLMRWYLDELTRIERDYADDAIRRSRGILALRKQLHHDIVKHRVSDSEYIRDRIRSGLTSARIVSLSEDYFDLPAPLALRLERVLDDGRMTQEEGRLVERVMQRSRLPEEARAVLLERVRTWVAEDADWG